MFKVTHLDGTREGCSRERALELIEKAEAALTTFSKETKNERKNN